MFYSRRVSIETDIIAKSCDAIMACALWELMNTYAEETVKEENLDFDSVLQEWRDGGSFTSHFNRDGEAILERMLRHIKEFDYMA